MCTKPLISTDTLQLFYLHTESLSTTLVFRCKLFSVEMSCTSLVFFEEYEGRNNTGLVKGHITQVQKWLISTMAQNKQNRTGVKGLSRVLTLCVMSLLDPLQMEDMEDFDDCLYCPACDKSFKSDKAWVTSSVTPKARHIGIISLWAALWARMSYHSKPFTGFLFFSPRLCGDPPSSSSP